MQEQKLERITPAQAGLDPQCIINMMDRMEKEHINITSFMLLRHGKCCVKLRMSRMMQHSCEPCILLAKPSLQWQLELQLEKERLTLMKRS